MARRHQTKWATVFLLNNDIQTNNFFIMTYRVSGYSLSLFYYNLLNFPFGNEYDSVCLFASSPFVFKIYTHIPFYLWEFPFFQNPQTFSLSAEKSNHSWHFRVADIWIMKYGEKKKKNKTTSQKICPKMGKLKMINLTFQKCFPPRYFIKIGK